LRTSDEGDDASSTTAETPAHQRRQQRHRDEINNRHRNNGKDVGASMVTTPSLQGQQPQLDDE
jgi:hypothetical protein